ncbi:MAG: NAD(P)-dependent oxidoreductase [Phycisphaerae bacterium]|nr:NAD(P)-dependent oxidoreductase [Phycisphaerae bacterium]
MTGATGFIGRNLTQKLVSEGWTVHIVTRPNSSLRPLEKIKQNIGIFCHDGTTESLCRFTEKIKPDIIFHLSSLFLASHNTADVEPLIKSNLLFGTQILEAAAKAQIRSFINVGTYWQHYENREYGPVCLYAASKQAFGAILQYYIETSQLKAVTLELYDTYGPDDPRPKLLNLLKNAAKTNEILEMSAGEQLLDMIHIDDVANAFIIAAERLLNNTAEKNETFCVCSGHPKSLRQIVTEFEKVKGLKLNIIWGKRPYRQREVMVPWNKGNKLPGWEPKIPLCKGLADI